MSVVALEPIEQTSLATVPAAERDHEWHGYVEGTFGAAAGMRFGLRARILMIAGMIEGAGGIGGILEAPQTRITICGAQHHRYLEFDLKIDLPTFPVPFACRAILLGGDRAIEGEWDAPCMHPGECGCSGAGGNFHFKRVELK